MQRKNKEFKEYTDNTGDLDSTWRYYSSDFWKPVCNSIFKSKESSNVSVDETEVMNISGWGCVLCRKLVENGHISTNMTPIPGLYYLPDDAEDNNAWKPITGELYVKPTTQPDPPETTPIKEQSNVVAVNFNRGNTNGGQEET